MAEDDPNRQRLEDMLKASEQRRTPGGGSQREGGEGEPSGERPSGGAPGGGEGEGGGRSSRATGTARKRVIAGLITGGLSIPGALIPILGLILGIAAIVLGVLVTRRSTDLRAKIAIGLGTLGVVLSIVSFVIGVIAFSDQSGDGGDDSEESDDGGGGDSEDGDGDSGGDGDGGDGDSGDGDSSSLPAPYAVAVTLHGERILLGAANRSGGT